MKLFITGATGFLGRFVVEESLRRGHAVRAVVRSASQAATLANPVEPAVVDLRSRKGLVDAMRGIDCVIHLAARKAGDMYAQLHGTVVTTENLLWAMEQADVRHIVHISTFSVYDYLKTPSHTLIDENSPLESVPENRDEYAQTKLIQEDLVISTAQRNNWKYTVLRPGVLYGPDNLWTARLGVRSGERLWIRTGARAILPLNYVENCAQVIVLAAEKEEANGQIFNVVDDDMPQQRQYLRLLRRQMTPPPRIVPVSWTVMRFLAHSAKLTNKYLFGNRAKIPGILVPAKLHARIKPLRYSNAKLKSELGWQPQYSLETALDRVKQRAQAPANQPAEAIA